MPLRSPKMYFCIFGFQRLVWWPKWTPASSSSFMVMLAMGILPSVRLARRTPAAPGSDRTDLRGVRDGELLRRVYLERTYSSVRSQVQTRSSPRPRPEVDRDVILRLAQIGLDPVQRTPSGAAPARPGARRRTQMATRSCSIRAAGCPSAIMIAPQFGSAPLMAVLTRGEFADAPASSGRRGGWAPRTATVDDHRGALAVLHEHERQALGHRLEAAAN